LTAQMEHQEWRHAVTRFRKGSETRPVSPYRARSGDTLVRRSGFTLLEVLVALVILTSAFTIIYTTFTTTMKAWRDGSTLLEDLRHGDFIMEQLVSALRSSAYFEDSGRYYGFRMEDSTAGRYPGDVLSWVTASSAFIPHDSPLARSMHRIEFTIADNNDGDPSVAITAYPYLADEEEIDDAEPWYISTEVEGFDVQFYNLEEEDWEDEWEDTNSVPALVQVTLFMPPLERYDDPVTLSRLIQIPVAGEVITNAVSGADADGGSASRSSGGSTPAAGSPAATGASGGSRPNAGTSGGTVPAAGGGKR